MTFEEFERIVLFAKQCRLKHVDLNGMHIEFFDVRKRKKKILAPTPDKPIPSAPQPPNLDDINRFIYTDPEEKEQ